MFTFLQPILYIQIAPDRLTVKNVKSGDVIPEVPEVAISASPTQRILGVGSQARMAVTGQAAQVVNPFAHPRSMVSDFTVAEQLIKAL